MKAENRGQLVRGVIIFSQWRAGRVSLEDAEDKDNVRVTAVYTPWHRHDDDLTSLDKELSDLSRVVMSFKDVDGASLSYEYRDYSK